MICETGVQSKGESYERLKKWFLMPPCTQYFEVWIKSKRWYSVKWGGTLPYASVLKLLKRKLSGHSDYSRPTYLYFIYIYIYSEIFFFKRALHSHFSSYKNICVCVYVTVCAFICMYTYISIRWKNKTGQKFKNYLSSSTILMKKCCICFTMDVRFSYVFYTLLLFF